MNRKQRRIAQKTRQYPGSGIGVQEQFDNALHYQHSGKPAEAELLLLQILADHPNHADSHNLLGIILFERGQTQEAISRLQQAIALNASTPVYRNNLGSIFRDIGRLDEAKALLEQALALRPDYADAQNNLGTIHYALRNMEKAIECFKRTLEIDPQYVNAHHNLGSLYMFQGALDIAQKHYENAFRAAPQSSERFMHLSLLRFHKTLMPEWSDLCCEALAYPFLEDKHRFDILVRLAIHHWCLGEIRPMMQALEDSQKYPWATDPNLDADMKNIWVFRSFMLKIAQYYANGTYAPQPSENKIALIGDSHCLTYVNAPLVMDGMLYEIVPHLVMGGKAFHLGRNEPNLFAQVFKDKLDSLPKGAKCIVTFGEIDCRFDGGIIKHFKKYGGDIDGITKNTAHNYVNAVCEAMRIRNLDVSFINVPAPFCENIREKAPEFTFDDEKLLVHVIRLFNACLAQAAAMHDAEIIDVYGLSVNAEGKSNGLHHIDGFHLKPYALAMALAAEKTCSAA